MNANATTAGQAPASFCADGTVAEVIIAHPTLRPVLERLGIDYCCGGKKPFAQAVSETGHDLKAVLEECRKTLQAAGNKTVAKDWTQASVTELANHILATHHVFTKAQLARVDGLLAKVQRAHAAAHGEMLEQARVTFDALFEELDGHLAKEEQILFPAILAIDGFLAGRNARPTVHCGRVAYPIQQMEVEHESAGNALVRLRELTNGYRLPDDVCATFEAFYDAMQALEADLHEHIHLENNILFPRSIAQEESLD